MLNFAFSNPPGENAMTAERISIAEAQALALRALCKAGASDASAAPLAEAVADAEAEGVSSHGLAYLPTYCAHLRCGKVDGRAVPAVETPRPERAPGPRLERVDALRPADYNGGIGGVKRVLGPGSSPGGDRRRERAGGRRRERRFRPTLLRR